MMKPFDINETHDGFDIRQLLFIDAPDKCYHVIEIIYNKARTLVKVDLDAEGGPPYHPVILSMDDTPWCDKSFTKKTGIDYKIAMELAIECAIN